LTDDALAAAVGITATATSTSPTTTSVENQHPPVNISKINKKKANKAGGSDTTGAAGGNQVGSSSIVSDIPTSNSTPIGGAPPLPDAGFPPAAVQLMFDLITEGAEKACGGGPDGRKATTRIFSEVKSTFIDSILFI
jgi:hypothetical protein